MPLFAKYKFKGELRLYYDKHSSSNNFQMILHVSSNATLPFLRQLSLHKDANSFEKHIKPVMLVLIR